MSIFIKSFVVPELTEGVDYTLNITTRVGQHQGGQGIY